MQALEELTHRQYEVVSGLRRACVYNILTQERAHKALHLLFGMHIEVAPGTRERHHRTLEWYEQLGRTRAYDARSLALVYELGAILWTSDWRMV